MQLNTAQQHHETDRGYQLTNSDYRLEPMPCWLSVKIQFVIYKCTYVWIYTYIIIYNIACRRVDWMGLMISVGVAHGHWVLIGPTVATRR